METEQTTPQFDPKTLTEKASFLLGHNFVQEFKVREVEIDIENMIKGIRAAAEGKNPPMTNSEIQAVMQAFEQSIIQQQQKKYQMQADENLRLGEEFLKQNALKEGVKEMENGVQYLVIKEGSGNSPLVTDRVKVLYEGKFINGKVFDSSGSEPAVYAVAGVMRGMSKALMKMKVGDKWKLFIPAGQAYGINGFPPVVGPNQTLIF